MQTTFESVVATCCDDLEGLSPGIFPPATPGHWTRPSEITACTFGFEQDSYFLSLAFGERTDGKRQRPCAVSTYRPGAMRVRLPLPDLPDDFQPDEDDEQRLDDWADHCRPVTDDLHLIAGGLALHALVQRSAVWRFAADCRFTLSSDLETDSASRGTALREALVTPGDAAMAAAWPFWFRSGPTRAWVVGLLGSAAELTMPAIDRLHPDVAAMVAGERRPSTQPTELEMLMRRPRPS